MAVLRLSGAEPTYCRDAPHHRGSACGQGPAAACAASYRPATSAPGQRAATPERTKASPRSSPSTAHQPTRRLARSMASILQLAEPRLVRSWSAAFAAAPPASEAPGAWMSANRHLVPSTSNVVPSRTKVWADALCTKEASAKRNAKAARNVMRLRCERIYADHLARHAGCDARSNRFLDAFRVWASRLHAQSACDQSLAAHGPSRRAADDWPRRTGNWRVRAVQLT